MTVYVNNEEESKPKKQITDYLWSIFWYAQSVLVTNEELLIGGSVSEPHTCELNFWVEFIIILLPVVRIPYVHLDCKSH